MSIVIQKFGGTSVGSVERMRHVCDLILKEKALGHDVVVVVSAMAGETNRLVGLASQFKHGLNSKAYDLVISTGENVSCGMLALALSELGVPAEPFAGWQVPIITNMNAGRASIQRIDCVKLTAALSKGVVPIVTGFQGVTDAGEITTLGRGGSDTSAAAIANALNALRCDIYTDIDGVYTADPRLVPTARRVDNLPFSIALPMTRLGAKVIHPRAVECAMRANLNMRVLSSFGSQQFTQLGVEGDAGVVIAHVVDSALLWIDGFDRDVSSEDILRSLHALDIAIDVWANAPDSLTVSLDGGDVSVAVDFLQQLSVCVRVQQGAKVSAVGALPQNAHIKAMDALARQNVTCFGSVVGVDRLSVVVLQAQVGLTVNTLHNIF